MKNLTFLSFFFTLVNMYSQNTLPTTGNVGVGTTTPESNLHIQTATGDTELIIGADSSNGSEDNNPYITFRQDNGSVNGFIGLAGNSNMAPQSEKYPRYFQDASGNWSTHNNYQGALPNYLLLSTDASNGIQLGTFGFVRMTLKETGDIGIGTNAPKSKFHISNGNSGGNSHGFSELTLEDDDHVMISLLTPNNKTAYYGFADQDDEYVGGMQYEHSLNRMTFRVNDHGHDMTIINNGHVGIGTTVPSEKLDVNGKTVVNSLKIDSNNSTSSVNGFSNRIEFTGGGHGAIVFHPGAADELMFGLHSNGNFYWGTGGASATKPNYYSMYLNGNNGNLGIRGKLTSNEVKVKLGGWADFVFENTYNLPTLMEVEQHINEKGHLKDIPSAKEVEENGIHLGEMNIKLLQKIEELTLYTIEQEKKLKKQEEKFIEQDKEITEIKKQLKQLLNTK